jgi:hypothetical protein
LLIADNPVQHPFPDRLSPNHYQTKDNRRNLLLDARGIMVNFTDYRFGKEVKELKP